MFKGKLSLHHSKSIDAKILTPSTNLPTFRLVTVTPLTLKLTTCLHNPICSFVALTLVCWSCSTCGIMAWQHCVLFIVVFIRLNPALMSWTFFMSLRWNYVRNFDRDANEPRYPRLWYPEIYVLDSGYREFFNKFPVSFKMFRHSLGENWHSNLRIIQSQCRNIPFTMFLGAVPFCTRN